MNGCASTAPSPTVGITDHAQEPLGDIVFVELPAPGREVAAGEACAVVESVKAASDVFAPLAGRVTETNAGARRRSGARQPRRRRARAGSSASTVADPAAFAALMDAEAYAKLAETA